MGTFLLLCGILLTIVYAHKWSGSKPNMVLILIDDMGWADIGCYGHPTIRTPYLDDMAGKGMKFTQFYSASPVCTPSRAAFMTGRFPVRSGMFSAWNNSDANVMTNVLHADGRGALPHDEIILPTLMKKAGYHSKIVGKWHLGIQEEHWPQKYGFDEFYGTPYSHGPNQGDQSVLPDMQLINNGQIMGRLYKDIDVNELHQMFQDNIIEYINRRVSTKEPFLLVFTPDNTHLPLFASKKFQGKSKMGIYGDTIEESDDIIGNIWKTIQSLKVENDTLFFFSSDNGPDMRDDLCFGESTLNCEIVQGGTAGQLKGGKATTWEGGIRVPGIFYWKDHIPNGVVTHEYGVLTDIFATALDLAGVPLPSDRKYDGSSLLDVLSNNTQGPHEYLYHWRGNKLMAVTHGRYKAHWYTQGIKEWNDPYLDQQKQPLLYDIWKDPGERFPFLTNHPTYQREMPLLQAAYDKHMLDVSVPDKAQLDVCDRASALWRPELPIPESKNETCCQDPCMTW